MPRNLNPLYTSLLEEWKQELEEKKPESHIVLAIGRAISSLSKATQVYQNPRDCGELKFFGPKILTTLENRLEEHHGGGTSSKGKRKAVDDAAPPKKRGRPNKKSIDDHSDPPDGVSGVVQIPRAVPRARATTQQAVEAGWDPYHVSTPNLSADPPRRTPAAELPFLFWYIDPDKKRVIHRDQASIQIRNECEVWYDIEYPSDQASHSFIRRLCDIKPALNGRYANEAHKTNVLLTTLACMCETDVQQRELSNPPPVAGRSRTITPADLTQKAGSFQSKPKPPTETLNRAPSTSKSRNLLTAEDLESELAEARKRMTLDPSRQRSFVGLKAQAEHSTQAEGSKSAASVAVPKPSKTHSQPAPRRTVTMPLVPSDRYSSPSPPPLPRFEAAPSRLPRTVSAPEATITAVPSRVRGKAPRASAQIPTPAVMDQDLEDALDRAAGRDVRQRRVEYRHDSSHEEFQLPFTPIIFPPNSYTISLVLDTREVKNHKDRDFIGRELKKRGINMMTRALELGDVCWTAKRNDGVDAGTGLDEAALDFILERKRIDDLIGSIKDSRFHEQKFRLAQSAITRVYYLVEEYSSDYVHKSMDKAVFTALSSTQIVEGFFLKETRDLTDTIEYLVGLHSAILDMHKDKALHVIPPDVIKRHSYVALQKQLRAKRPDVSYLTTYASFRELNKSGSVTLRDFFARMLLCISGMSAEKVSVVIEKYDTPFSLDRAFKAAEEQERRELALEASLAKPSVAGKRKKKSTVMPAKLMLTNLEGKGRRHIGDALSTQVYELFRGEEYAR